MPPILPWGYQAAPLTAFRHEASVSRKKTWRDAIPFYRFRVFAPLLQKLRVPTGLSPQHSAFPAFCLFSSKNLLCRSDFRLSTCRGTERRPSSWQASTALPNAAKGSLLWTTRSSILLFRGAVIVARRRAGARQKCGVCYGLPE